MIASDTIPVSNDTFTVREIGEEIIFLNEKGDMLHTLNEVGSFVWKSIDGTRSVGDILELMCGEYDVSRDKAEKDLITFLNELTGKKIVYIEA